MTATMYLDLVDRVSAADIGDVIATMDHDSIRALRSDLEALNCRQMVMPLFYDYERQVWI